MNDTLRSRGFTKGSTEERLIAMAQSHDNQQKELGEVHSLLDQMLGNAAEQQKEIAVLKEKVISEQDLFDRAHQRGNDLQKKIEALETKLDYAEDAAAKGNLALARMTAGGMEMEIAELRKDKERLALILRLLHDHQNGPPLPSYEVPWGHAMKMAVEILNKCEPEIEAAMQETKASASPSGTSGTVAPSQP